MKRITIATHNGSQVRQNHNLRIRSCVEKEKHIRPDGEHEVWHHEKLSDAYHRLFDESVKAYNQRQKRDDRKIKNYLSRIQQDGKKHAAYEMIVGVYGTDPKQSKDILHDFVRTWNRRNPNLELIGAYWHADEKGQPHVHIDYIPVANDCKRGPERQTSLTKALTEQGVPIGKNKTLQIAWERQQNAYLTQLCRVRELRVEHKPKRKHLEKELFMATKDLEAIRKEVRTLENSKCNICQDIEEKQKQLDEIKSRIQNALGKLKSVEYEVGVAKDAVAKHTMTAYELEKKIRDMKEWDAYADWLFEKKLERDR